MWKLLPVCLLAGCAAINQQPADSNDTKQDPGRIVRQTLLPLAAPAPAAENDPLKRAFQGARSRGWLDETGAWHLRTEVDHGRIRCRTYRAGIQLGKGSPTCSNVEWLTGVEYATRLLHCNSASRPHSGGGRFPAMANRIQEVTCVRVLVRCEGGC